MRAPATSPRAGNESSRAQLRYGISDELDFGARIANMTSLGGDVKWNFVRTPMFDMAVDPGVQWYNVTV